MPVKTSAAKQLVSSAIDLASTDVTGILPVSKGGSGGSTALTNGQVWIGSTGVAPVPALITGTSNRISVTGGAGTITLSTPQATDTGATPTFAGVTLGSATVTAAATTARAYSIPDVITSSKFVMDNGDREINDAMTLKGLLTLDDAFVFDPGFAGVKCAIIVGSNAGERLYTIPDVAPTDSKSVSASFIMNKGPSVFEGALATKAMRFYYSQINAAYTTSTTLLVGDLISGFIQFTNNTAGITLTFPTGTVIETAISDKVTPYNGMSFDFLFWNYNTNGVTLGSASGVNFQIMATTQPGSTARMYRMIRTTTNTFTIYNMS